MAPDHWSSLVMAGDRRSDAAAPKRLTPSNSALDLFGSEVRRYRVLANYSIKQLGDKIPYSPSFIGAVERAESHCERKFAEHCDNVPDTKQASRPPPRRPVRRQEGRLPEWFRKWPTVEEETGTLKVYSPIVVHGLFQTMEYASSLLFDDSQAVESRMARQAILSRTTPNRLACCTSSPSLFSGTTWAVQR